MPEVPEVPEAPAAPESPEVPEVVELQLDDDLKKTTTSAMIIARTITATTIPVHLTLLELEKNWDAAREEAIIFKPPRK